MSQLLTPDICVIGGGSAGLSVAAGAAAFGVPVVLVEKGPMGGDCLNFGCVPSKALIAAARHRKAIADAAGFGIACDAAAVDFARVHDHVHSTIAAIAPHDSEARFTGLGVRVIRDAARFTAPDTVVAGDCTIRARRFVIAAGSSPALPPIVGLDRVGALTNETVFDLAALPRHLVVLGGGPVGMELAQAFRRLGSAVTLLEAGGLLGHADPELVPAIADALRQDGVTIREGARVERIEPAGDGGVRLHLAGSGPVEGSHLLIAAGRRPNTDGLGLEAAGIAHDGRGIRVDAGLRTSNRRVYAIGDIAGGGFTHVAGYQAGIVLRSILFRLPARMNPDAVPWAVFTDPELAHVGLTEAAARARDPGCRVVRVALPENDRARTDRVGAGLLKVVAGRNGRVLGATLVAPDAAEMIGLWALAVTRRLRLSAIAGTILPYPTLSESARRAATEFYRPGLTRPLVRRIIAALRRFG